MSFRRRRLLRAGHNHVDRARAGPSRRHHPLLGQRISGLVLPADRRPAARSDAGPSRVGPPRRRAAGPFPLVVPDLRAHGQSTGSFDFAAAVDDVGALLEALPTDELILVGLSLGANIAQDLVQQDPGRVRALVLADATSNTAPPAPHVLHVQCGRAAVAGAGQRARVRPTSGPGDGLLPPGTRVRGGGPPPAGTT